MMNVNFKYRDEIMDIGMNRYFKKYLSSLVVLCFLFIQPAYATDWVNSLEDKNGFTEFAPPVRFKSNYDHEYNKKKFEWRSGSSFKEFNKDRYVNSRVTHNPWKPVKTYGKKRSFNGQRPWGNIPVKKPSIITNMRVHDQRFKKWITQMDVSYPRGQMFAEPRYSYGNDLPGGFVPFAVNVPNYNGVYPGGYYKPYSGLSNRPWVW